MTNCRSTAPVVRYVIMSVVTCVSLLAGCSTTSGVAGQASRALADVALPASQEEKLGERFSQQVREETDIHPNPDVQQYIRELGGLAVRAAIDEVPRGIGFSFAVIDAPDQINAFAGPGGEIYFFSGLLREADDTAEVLSVMCHEVAHVTERHIAQRLVAAHGVNLLASAALGEKPSLVEQIVAGVVAQGFMMKYSRDHETQADSTGFDYMIDTGYDPHGFVSFFQKLQSAGPSPPEFLSSHPNPENRIESIKQKIRDRKSVSDKRGREKHETVLEQLGDGTTALEWNGAGGAVRAVRGPSWKLLEF